MKLLYGQKRHKVILAVRSLLALKWCIERRYTEQLYKPAFILHASLQNIASLLNAVFKTEINSLWIITDQPKFILVNLLVRKFTSNLKDYRERQNK